MKVRHEVTFNQGINALGIRNALQEVPDHARLIDVDMGEPGYDVYLEFSEEQEVVSDE